MIFEFENLGSIKKAELEVGNLTVICGKNNTGKTYLTYAVWGMLVNGISYNRPESIKLPKTINKNIFTKLNSGETIQIDISSIQDVILKILNTNLEKEITSHYLQRVFDIDFNFFQDASVKLKVSNINYDNAFKNSYAIENFSKKFVQIAYEKDINSKLLKIELKDKNTFLDEFSFKMLLRRIALHFIPSTFIFTAQRDAIHIFKNAINRFGRYVIRAMKDSDINNFIPPRYALPLEWNIDFASATSDSEKSKSSLLNSDLMSEIENILEVKYQVHSDNFFIKDSRGNVIPAHLASTSVRVLADLHFYLKHVAQEGDLLMIDEPELSLHPENQIKVARLLVKLVNAGLKVWITTHSDYIIKELNNCLMLSNEKIKGKQKLMKELKYKKDEILNPSDLKMYIAADGTLEKIEYDDFGMLKSAFDEAMITQDNNSNAIAESISKKR